MPEKDTIERVTCQMSKDLVIGSVIVGMQKLTVYLEKTYDEKLQLDYLKATWWLKKQTRKMHSNIIKINKKMPERLYDFTVKYSDFDRRNILKKIIGTGADIRDAIWLVLSLYYRDSQGRLNVTKYHAI